MSLQDRDYWKERHGKTQSHRKAANIKLDPKIWNTTRSQQKVIKDKYLIAFGLFFIGVLMWLVFKPLYL